MAGFLLVIIVIACIVSLVVIGGHGARVNATSPDELANAVLEFAARSLDPLPAPAANSPVDAHSL